MIFYTRGDRFNRWYLIGEHIEETFDSMTLPMVWLVACGLKLNFNICCSIDYTDNPTKGLYQINDILDNILQDKRNIQWAVSNWR